MIANDCFNQEIWLVLVLVEVQESRPCFLSQIDKCLPISLPHNGRYIAQFESAVEDHEAQVSRRSPNPLAEIFKFAVHNDFW